MFNVIKNKSQLSHNIIEGGYRDKFWYKDYQAIFGLKLLSYLVVTDAWLAESGQNFVWNWSILDNLLL